LIENANDDELERIDYDVIFAEFLGNFYTTKRYIENSKKYLKQKLEVRKIESPKIFQVFKKYEYDVDVYARILIELDRSILTDSSDELESVRNMYFAAAEDAMEKILE